MGAALASKQSVILSAFPVKLQFHNILRRNPPVFPGQGVFFVFLYEPEQQQKKGMHL